MDLSTLFGQPEYIWFELTFLLLVSLLASFVFARFGQPKVIGYILVGVIIGPSVLGIIVPQVDPVTHELLSETGLPEAVMFLAQLGSIILLFMIGLECDLREVYTRRSIAIALGGVILPWIVGFLVAEGMGYESDAIFIGATLVATSVAITAGVVSELGMIGTPVAYAIVGAAVVDDVLGMVVLAISRSLSGAGGFEALEVSGILIAAVLFIVLGAYVGSKILTKLVYNVQISGFKRKLPMSGFILVLTIAFLYSFIAELIGLSAIVGAFVAGTAFSGSAMRDGFRKGTMYLEALFVPLFFVSLGVIVDVSAIGDGIWFAIILTIVAFASKIIGCWLPARATGMNAWDSLAVGVGMTPRLEIALIIAFIGRAGGIIDNQIYAVIVFMAIATALFAPMLLKMTLKAGGHELLSLDKG